MRRHGADMLRKVGTYEEIRGERKERWNEGDTGRRIETDIFIYKHAHTYKHASHRNVILHRFFTAPTLLHTNPFAHTGFYTRTFRHRKIAILPQFLTLEPHSCERVTTSWRLVGTACGLKREKKKEGERLWQRARDREREKMRRCEDVKMRRWEDAQMWRCEDVKMWRWEDVKMIEDVKMRRGEDVMKMWTYEAE